MLPSGLYAAMPVIYMALPVAIEVGVLGSVGSVFAGTWAAGSLLIGWEVRFNPISIRFNPT